MIYSVYHPDSGKIAYHTNIPPHDAPWVEGEWHPKHYRVVNGVAVAEEPVLDIAELSAVARQQRDQALGQVDRVNPIWYATLTSLQQTELAAYRQALLDVPQQVGFPESVAWPQQPTWL